MQSKAQLAVTTGQTAQQLAEIIAGPGVVVSNASITGSADAIGAFTTGANNTGLGIASGVVLASGEVIDIPQANNLFAGTGLGTPGEPYLAAQAGTNSLDAVILQFDFVPNADFVSFNYAFGSEEYPEFICSAGGYNDIFAFTIEGSSVPLAQTNIALIPGTTFGVSVNNINDDPGCGGDYAQYYIDNTSGPASQYIVYDGLTVVLTAEANVICGETYTLKLMLSDGGDSAFDSGCFIEENSLTTGNVTIQTSSLGGDTAAIEGCADLDIQLTLNGAPPTQDVPVSVWIGGGSTATWGVDYDPISEINLADSTVTIPAGSNTVVFSISPVNDGVSEGVEIIDLVAVTSTCGDVDTFRLYIAEVDPLEVVASNDTTICVGNAIAYATGVGGGGGYTFTWDNGFGITDTIYPTPTQTTVYTVTVEDGCDSPPAQDSVLVIVDDGPEANAGNDISVCIGGSVVLNASSNTPGNAFSWNPPTDLSDPDIFNPICTPQQDMEYVVQVTRPDGCFNTDTVLVTLTDPPTGVFDLPTVGCAGDPLIAEYAGNANASGQYNWNFDGGIVTNGSGGGPLAVYWPAPGIYDVELTVSWNGCLSPTEVNQIEILGPPSVNAGSDISFCSGDSGPIGSAPIAGLTYSWSPANGVADPLSSSTTVQLINPTNDIQVFEYVLTAIDQGCKNYDTIDVTVFPIPTAQFSIPKGMCFNVNSFDLLASGNFGPNASFQWDFGPVGFPQTSTDLQPQGVIFNQPGNQPVTLVVTDNTCVSEPFVGTIEVFEMPVADFSFDVSDGCEPLTVTFQDQSYNGNSTLYRIWNFGNNTSATQQSPSVVYDKGVYSVTLGVTTAHGCSDQVTRTDIIEAYEKPNALFEMSDRVLSIIDPDVIVTNLADSIVASEFTFHPFGHVVNGFEAQYEYPDTGTYQITQVVTTANGCTDTITGSLKVEPYYTFYIPDAFTPDNNGINETWIPQGESIRSFNMTIYNRWDQEIFYSASLDEPWDGTFKGKPVQQGVYIYSIDVIDILGEPHKYRGTFSLFR